MSKISATGKYTLLTSGGHEQTDPAEFKVSLERELTAIISVDYQSKEITTCIHDITVPDDFVNLIQKIGRFDFEQVPDHLQEEVTFISKSLSGGTKKVVSLVKYYLRHVGISESLFSVKSTTWQTDGSSSFELPSSLSASVSSLSSEPLRSNTIKNVQASIDDNMEPLIAMRHLHRAKEENISHHKWIDATIAAELAVKEVLASVKPELEMLLMEMPSPPLAKLYGSILEKYLGERSPYLKYIREGVEVRNRLIHKPYAENIDAQAANDYVEHIEGAIFHLLKTAYPDNALILNAYDRVKL